MNFVAALNDELTRSRLGYCIPESQPRQFSNIILIGIGKHNLGIHKVKNNIFAYPSKVIPVLPRLVEE